MFSFLQQLVPKRRDDLDADEDAYAESSAMPAFVPPAPLVKPPLTEDEIAEQEREAAEAEERDAAERAEAERLEREALDDEKRRAEERLVERQARAHELLEARAAERQRREEAHLAATGATLVAVPDLETESESDFKSESEPVEALDAHVVEDEPPTIEEDGEQVYEPAPVDEHDEHDEHHEDAFAFVPPAPEAEHAADDFAFVPPAPQIDRHVDPAEDIEAATLADHVDVVAPEEHVDAVALEEPVEADEQDEPLALEEHVEPLALEEHVDDAEPVAVVADPDPEPEVAALEPVVEPELERQHVHAHVGAPQSATVPAPDVVPAPVERYTWPATLLHHEHAMQYGEGARRNLISMIVELNDAKLARVLHDALYEERAEGLRPEVLSALQRSYNGEDLRETYERFVRIGSDREREIASEGLRSLDEGHA